MMLAAGCPAGAPFLPLGGGSSAQGSVSETTSGTVGMFARDVGWGQQRQENVLNKRRER